MKRTPLKRGKPLARGQPLQRTGRLKSGPGGSLFPRQRDAPYRRWVRTTQSCLIAGASLARAISPRDEWLGMAWLGVKHHCWGAIDPAHVGPHQATGAPDAGVIVPLCRAAHVWYDEHRASWVKIGGPTEATMLEAAARLWAQYQRETGAP